MSATDITIRKGTGPDQLPQGAASELSAKLPTETVIDSEQPGALGLQPAPRFPNGNPATGGRDFVPGKDQDSSILFGDAEGVGGGAQLPPGRLPDSVVRWLPAMKAAASEPNAPDSLRAIYAAAVHSLEQELRR